MAEVIRKVGAAVLSADGQRLLVVRKRGRDVFILPGGKPEPGEDPRRTLDRELREELGVGVLTAEPLLSVADTAVFEDVPLEMEVYLAVLDGAPAAGAEIEELAYVPADHAASGLRLATGITKHVLPALHPATATGRVALLFSGGRDSTAVAVGLHDAGHPLDLLCFRSGLGTDSGLQAIRVAELERLWPADAFQVHVLPVAGLVRELCFRDLVEDILADRRQLILLGEALAMLARAIGFCRDRGVASIAMGASGYQRRYPEQRPETLEAFGGLCAEFGIEFLTPGTAWKGELEVKDRLRVAGLSAKSLESESLLADLDDDPPDEAVLAFLRRKMPTVRALAAGRVPTGAA